MQQLGRDSLGVQVKRRVTPMEANKEWPGITDITIVATMVSKDDNGVTSPRSYATIKK